MAIFKKRRKYFTLETELKEDEVLSKIKPSVPEGMYHKCGSCEKLILKENLMNNLYICPVCGAYERMGAYQRIDLICDEDTFREINQNLTGKDPLNFPNYEEKLKGIQRKTNLKEGIVTGYGRVGGIKVAMGAMDSQFIMGSMGSAVGEKVALLAEFALTNRLPLIIFSASGGARMQEGIVSLMQMAKVSAAIKKHSDGGLLYISVPTDPTTGGVTASFAMLGDFILSEPKAIIGFAGRRVIEGTIGKKLPDEFQRAEFLMKHGFLDGVIKREKMKDYLIQILRLHGGGQNERLG